ncbi:MAG: hypothetical protein JXB39_05970 [Deltaproteobacteria bacterium]|nr:hypothetical protein [Deltaproteobacteria bacterium]
MSLLLFAASLLAAPALGQEALALPPPAASPSGPAVLEITSTKPAVMLARIESRSTGYVSGMGFGYASGGVIGGGSAVVNATQYRDLCVTPCRVELPAGFHELAFYGQGYRSYTEMYDLLPGETKVLSVHPGSFGVAYLSLLGATAGLTSLLTGGIFLAMDAGKRPAEQLLGLGTDVALIGGGAVLTGLGIWGMKASRTIVTDVTPESVKVTYQQAF